MVGDGTKTRRFDLEAFGIQRDLRGLFYHGITCPSYGLFTESIEPVDGFAAPDDHVVCEDIVFCQGRFVFQDVG